MRYEDDFCRRERDIDRDKEQEALRRIAASWRRISREQRGADLGSMSSVRIDMTKYFSGIYEGEVAVRN